MGDPIDIHLSPLGYSCAVKFSFVRRNQLTAGLAPVGVRPHWAYKKRGGMEQVNPCPDNVSREYLALFSQVRS